MTRFVLWIDKIIVLKKLGRNLLNKSHKARCAISTRRIRTRSGMQQTANNLLCCTILGWIYVLFQLSLFLSNFLLKMLKSEWSPSRALPVVTAHALMSRSREILTIVDSGCSQHFSGIRDDFSAIKRWDTPRVVQVADGKTIQCEGHGTISFRADNKEVTLKKVWFVPEFGNTRLLSVWRFNEREIDVDFVKR